MYMYYTLYTYMYIYIYIYISIHTYEHLAMGSDRRDHAACEVPMRRAPQTKPITKIIIIVIVIIINSSSSNSSSSSGSIVINTITMMIIIDVFICLLIDYCFPHPRLSLWKGTGTRGSRRFSSCS